MKRLEIRVVGAILLIAAGVLFLLQNLGFLGGALSLLWMLVFAAGGAVFLYIFLADQTNWWAIIPGFALLSLAATVALSEFAPESADPWTGTLFLGGIGMGFWAIYLTNREHWWAVIPGGVLITIGVVAGISSFLEGDWAGAVFFLGLGLTFGLLSLLRTPEGRMKWALIPAVVMLVMGLVITFAATEVFRYIWPAALILVGLYLIFRTLISQRS